MAYTIDEMRGKIERSGIRLTPQRAAIVDALSHFSGIFSVGDLQKGLEQVRPDIGRATLFRAIDLFVRLGVLEKVHRESAEDGYIIGVTGHHHHLICRRCGEVRHVDLCPIQGEIDDLVRKEGYSETVHRFEIEGLCSACRAAMENQMSNKRKVRVRGA